MGTALPWQPGHSWCLSLSLCPLGISRPSHPLDHPCPFLPPSVLILQDHTGAESEPKSTQVYFGNAEAFRGADNFSLHITLAKAICHSLSSIDPPQSQWGAHLPGVWKTTQSPTPSATSCFPEYTLSLSLVPCHLFWEKLPSCPGDWAEQYSGAGHPTEKNLWL